MKVINIIDSIEDINIGMWGAAISTSNELLRENIETECWYFKGEKSYIINTKFGISFVRIFSFIGQIKHLINSRGLDKVNTLIISHGSWRSPTYLAYRLVLREFKWVYVPQGMLEPWALSRKYLKKYIYLALIEKPMVQKASLIRAVSRPEMVRLKKLFPRKKVILLANGTHFTFVPVQKQFQQGFLFMSRLHEKKGVVPLVKAWIKSGMSTDHKRHLYIAGPDHGELKKIKTIIQSTGSTNITYCGILDDAGKREYFSKSDFFILPSFSEGFPTSVVEAMAAGLVPIISSGCNFPEAFEAGFAFNVEPDVSIIAEILKKVRNGGRIEEKRRKAISEWTTSNYSLESIAQQQIEMYKYLISTDNVYSGT
jgi:glycosyltransferase involved in cell wall biosynthesis